MILSSSITKINPVVANGRKNWEWKYSVGENVLSINNIMFIVNKRTGDKLREIDIKSLSKVCAPRVP